MTTVNELVNQALKDTGVIASSETPSADEASDAIAVLKQMIGQWQAQKMFVTGQRDISFSPTGAQTYSIGPGATIDVPLPVSIDAAFWRFNNVDYPAHVLDAFEDYENITLKTISSTIPTAIFYQRNYPQGTVYVWPQPSTGEIHLVVREVLTVYSALTDDLSVPAEYELAMRYSLGELLLLAFGLSQRQDISALATRARKVMKRNNLQIPMMGVADELINGGRFSIYSGQ